MWTKNRLRQIKKEHPKEKRLFGYFQCEKCDGHWASSHVYTKWYSQKCKRCQSFQQPYKVHPLKCSQCGISRQEGCTCAAEKSSKPHRAKLCQRCIDRGRPCTEPVPFLMDYTSAGESPGPVVNMNDYIACPSTSFVPGMLSREEAKTVRFTPEVEQSEFRHQSTDFREAQIAEIDIKPNKALLDQMISAEKKSKEQVKLTTKQSPAKSRDAVDLRLVKTEQESALTESRATDLESTPPRKNGKERLEARLAMTRKQIEQNLHYLPAFKILPQDSPHYLKFERKLKALRKQKECLERLISK